VLTLRVSGTYGTETTDDAVRRINAVLDRLERHPQVEAAGVVSTLPGLSDEQQVEYVLAEGRAAGAPYTSGTRAANARAARRVRAGFRRQASGSSQKTAGRDLSRPASVPPQARSPRPVARGL
jgi:hypothetical protein